MTIEICDGPRSEDFETLARSRGVDESELRLITDDDIVYDNDEALPRFVFTENASHDVILTSLAEVKLDGLNLSDVVVTVAGEGLYGDGPSVPTLVTDDTDIPASASDDFSGIFATLFGNDGAAAADALTYALDISAPDVDSGLVDTLSGDSILLRKVSDSLIEGYLESTPATVAFTVAVDAAGEVTQTQLRSVVHDDPTDPEEDTSPATLAAGLISLTATATDGDGDTASATADIGNAFTFEDDGPTVTAEGAVPTLVTDDTDIPASASDHFSGIFATLFGNDGAAAADALTYALDISAPDVDSGLVDTLSGDSILLRKVSDSLIEGYLESTPATVAFTVAVDAAGEVTQTQLRSVVHDDPTDPEEDTSPATLAAGLISLTATATDGDGDTASATADIGNAFTFEDDGPTVTAEGAVPTLVTDDTDIPASASDDFSGIFATLFGNDGEAAADALTYALDVSAPDVDSGLVDTLSGDSILLRKVSDSLIEGYLESTPATVAFTVAVDAAGEVTQTQLRSVVHDDPTDPEEDTSPATLAAGLISLTATATDGDGDTASATADIGNAFTFEDDGPTITVAPPAMALRLGNAVGEDVTGAFKCDIGSDSHTAAYYTAGGSDFVDQDPAAGVQIALSGTVSNSANPNITNANVTLTSESATAASFNFSFSFDKDLITAGVQTATAGGTLAFDKVAGTYTVTLIDVVDGFGIDVLHTSELVAKLPTGNAGHPNIVVEQHTPNGDPNPFFVQFTADNTPLSFSFTGDQASTGDTSFNGAQHDLAGGVETWVSATQNTNGVAGDTIQKNELLTLRFFEENILGDVALGVEKTDPTTTASGIALKFDGIGANEDLILFLDLKDDKGTVSTADDVEITKAVIVENADIFRKSTPGGVPFPYHTEFSLDNNDGLVIVESNDYNAAGENFQIQGVQIMQSANGLTGSGINLNKVTGDTGGSPVSGPRQAFNSAGSHDNDVLKIVDIGFVQNTSGTLDADLDFSFRIADGDADTTSTQHLLIDISNDFII